MTNGARGTVVGIMLNPKEPPPDNTPIVKLRYLPSYVLVKLDRTRTSRLQGLEEGVIPITPVYQYYKVQVKNAQGKYITKTIRRLQYAMTGAYSFTDYRSQGQTMPVLIVDIAPPPTGGALNIFNTYVALSRSSGRDTIRLLRNFKEELFLDPDNYPESLQIEDERLVRKAVPIRDETEGTECAKKGLRDCGCSR